MYKKKSTGKRIFKPKNMDGFKLYLCGYACHLQYNFAKAFYLKKKRIANRK